MRHFAIVGAILVVGWGIVAAWALAGSAAGSGGSYGNVMTLEDERAAALFGATFPGIYVVDRDGLLRTAVRGGMGMIVRGVAFFDWSRARVGLRGVRAGLLLTREGWRLLLFVGASLGALLAALAARSAEPFLGLVAAGLGAVFVIGILIAAKDRLIGHALMAQFERRERTGASLPTEASLPPPSPAPRHGVRSGVTEIPEQVGDLEETHANIEGGIEGGVEGYVEGGVPGGVFGDGPVDEHEILRVQGDIQPPQRISAPPPAYSELARRARIQGVVIVEAVIDEQGNVTNAKVLKGLPMGLDEAALEAIRQWKFRPATLGGRPVTVYYVLTVNFRLSEAP